MKQWNEKRLRIATDAAGVALWTWNVDTDELTMDARAFDLWAIPYSSEVKFADLSLHIHPADQNRVRVAFTATRAVVGAYEIDFRIVVGDKIRWISARGQGNDDGLRDGNMFGIFLDVTGRKQAEEAHELLAGEMSHRVKNLLQIATVLTEITSRSAKTTTEMVNELTHRLTALGRAHDLVRPMPGNHQEAALLGDLLAVLLAPYDDSDNFHGRVRVSVPMMGVGETAASGLALVIHELATNSLKYGALSTAIGMLDVSCTDDSTGDEIVIVWAERNGPAVKQPVAPAGFGSKMVNRTIAQQLGGSLTFDWAESGLIVTLHIKRSRLLRSN